jgi:hypothetical protein
MGRGGLYYRRTLPLPTRNPDANPSGSNESFSGQPSHQDIDPIHEQISAGMTGIESGDVASMADSTSKDLLDELNGKRKRMTSWPIALTIVFIVFVIFLILDFPFWGLIIEILIGAAVVGLAGYSDQLKKTTVILYDLEDEAQQAYQRLHDAYDKLFSCSSVWHVEAKGDINDAKRNAGAATSVERNEIRAIKSMPAYVKTNLVVPVLICTEI